METTPPLTPAKRCSYLAERIVEERPEIPRRMRLLPPPSPLIFQPSLSAVATRPNSAVAAALALDSEVSTASSAAVILRKDV